MSLAGNARLVVDLLRSEGLPGFAERLAERGAEVAERLAERPIPAEGLAREAGRVPVLDVLAVPFAPRWGGVPTQLRARLAEERRRRPTALLAPSSGSWTLRVTAPGRETWRARLAPCGARGPGLSTDGGPSGDARAAVDVVAEAARLVGAGVVNIEGTAGWPPAALRSLSGRGWKLVVSLHDFALFCPRPHLIEEPVTRFCGYSRDAARCAACLGATWELPAGFVEAWRRDSDGLLAAADAVVFSSGFLLRRHEELFPAARSGLRRIIEPPAPGDEAGRAAAPTRSIRREGPLRVAFVGAFRPHKGATVLLELLRRSALAGRPVRWSVLGSGDPALLREARRRGARVVGHYRAGSLARRLREMEIDVALLLSVWPETYSLTLTECRAAGVPVVSFDLGAIADRIVAEGGGIVVPLADGAEGIAAALDGLAAGHRTVPPFRGGRPGADARTSAAERERLYGALLGEVR